MPRPEKVAVVDEVREKLTSSTATVLTEYRGLTVSQLAALRAELRKNNAEYKVAKNTLTRIAAREAGFEVPDELLSGPTALAFCADDPVGVAKALRTFAKANPSLVVKGAVLDGRLIDAAETSRLADLETREELLAKMAGMIQTLIAQPARLAQASLTKMAQLLAAYSEKKAAEPQPAAEAAAPAEAAEESAPEEAAAPEAEEAKAPAETEPAAEAPAEEPAAEEAATEE
ncbi:MAG TPA: 50S ribosomal protein L10 [Egibacteraceae bacterium]|nr:50S ribosomal protein L10 [Egibacteraceae bacterium]